MEEKEREEDIGDGVWSWGAGTDGQLATNKLQDENFPQLISSLSFTTKPISQLACGGAHVIALSKDDGKVLTWGRGSSGQLGHGDQNNCLYPLFVKSLESFFISHVSAGWNHSGFVSNAGHVFTCGDGSFGQLGHGDYQSRSLPIQVLNLEAKHVQQIACGMRHTLVLLKGHLGNPIYGFGSGKRGQLGVSIDRIRKSYNLPQIVAGFEEVEIANIIANGDQSAALTVDGHLYSWGKGFCGKSDTHHPLESPIPLKFIQVALGWNHALALTDFGKLFIVGGKLHGMLSDPQNMSLKKCSSNQTSSSKGSEGKDPYIFSENYNLIIYSDAPGTVSMGKPKYPEMAIPFLLTKSFADDSKAPMFREVPGLDGTKVVDIAAGAEHSALVTENGRIMTWGWGEHGQLGLGNEEDQTTPQLVSLAAKLVNCHTRFNVYCGSGFTFAIGKGSLV